MTSGVGHLGFAEALPAAARTTTTNGSAVNLASEVTNQFNYLASAGPGGPALMAIVTCGAASGTTPTLDLKVQYSADGSTGWTDITGATFTQLTAAGREAIRFVSPQRYIRIVATIAGTTPSFTFGVIVVGVERFA